jgi:hypothetical protein
LFSSDEIEEQLSFSYLFLISCTLDIF